MYVVALYSVADFWEWCRLMGYFDWETARIPNRPPEFKVDSNGMMELPGNDWCIIQVCRI